MLRIERVPESEHSRHMVAEVQFGDDQGIIPPNLIFPRFALNTYDSLRDMSTKGDHVYHLVNAFFATFNLEEQRALYDYYVEMKLLINAVTVETVGVLRKKNMTILTTKVLTDLRVAERAIQFINDVGVPFPEFPEELRNHDTEKMTFRRPEYVDLTAVSLVSKVMSPIWGDFINVMKKPIVNEFDKEINCYLILIDVLRTGAFAYIYERFSKYLKVTVNKALTSSDPTGRKGSSSFSLASNGFVVSRLQEMVYAITLVKKFVIHDVWKLPNGGTEPPNIMTYSWDVLIKTAKSKISNMRDKSPFLPRFELAETSSGATDNTTLLDHGSRSSRVPFDYRQIARMAAQREFDRLIAAENLPKREIERALKFYDANVVRPNILNKAICASIFAKNIGGSELLDYFRKDEYTKMVTVAQFYLIKLGIKQIVPFMSARSDDTMKAGPSDAMASRSANAMTTTREFRECGEFFPTSTMSAVVPEYRRDEMGGKPMIESVGILTQLTRIQTWISMYTHWYNVAPSVWNYMKLTEDQIPMHDEDMVYGEHIMQDVCKLFLHEHKYKPKLQGDANAAVLGGAR